MEADEQFQLQHPIWRVFDSPHQMHLQLGNSRWPRAGYHGRLTTWVLISGSTGKLGLSWLAQSTPHPDFGTCLDSSCRGENCCLAQRSHYSFSQNITLGFSPMRIRLRPACRSGPCPMRAQKEPWRSKVSFLHRSVFRWTAASRPPPFSLANRIRHSNPLSQEP